MKIEEFTMVCAAVYDAVLRYEGGSTNLIAWAAGPTGQTKVRIILEALEKAKVLRSEGEGMGRRRKWYRWRRIQGPSKRAALACGHVATLDGSTR